MDAALPPLLASPAASCPGGGDPGPSGAQAYRDVDLHAITVPSGLVHLRCSITAEGVVGDLQGVRQGAVAQDNSGGEFLQAEGGVLGAGRPAVWPAVWTSPASPLPVEEARGAWELGGVHGDDARAALQSGTCKDPGLEPREGCPAPWTTCPWELGRWLKRRERHRREREGTGEAETGRLNW